MSVNVIQTEDLLQKEVTRRKDRITVISQVANKKYEGTLKEQGDTVQVQQFPLLNGNMGGTAGSDINIASWAIAKFPLTIDKVYQNGADVKDIEEVQSNLQLRGQLAQSFAKSSAINEDQFVASLSTLAYASNKVNNQAPVTLIASNTYSEVTKLSLALSEANDDEIMKILFISPAIKQKMKLENILNSTEIGLEMRLTGEIGEIDGFRVVETRNLAKLRTLTIDTIPTAGDTLTIQGKVVATGGGYQDEDVVFTYAAAAAAAGEITIGSLAVTQANTVNAINGSGDGFVDVVSAKRVALKNAFVKSGAFASDVATISGAYVMTPEETFTAGTNIFGVEAELMFATGMNAINYVSQLDQTKITNATKGFRSNILQERVFGGAVLGDNAKGIATSEILVTSTNDLN